MPRLALRATVCALGVWVSTAAPHAQTPQQQGQASAAPQTAHDSDPTQVVFFSTRSEFTDLAGDAWRQVFIARSDRAVLRDPKWKTGKIGVLTRFDFPVVVSDLGAGTKGGLGDLYLQALYAPILSRRFALALGTGFGIPTATDTILGTGKWRFAPLVVPVWFFPRAKGFFFTKIQEYISFAGDADRADINYLLVTPTVMYRPARRWWLLGDTETKIDWERDDRAVFTSGLEVGYVVSRRLGLAVKPEIAWGPNREKDWTLKAIATWYRVR